MIIQYETWNIKLRPKAAQGSKIEQHLKDQGILGDEWTGFPGENGFWNFSAKKFKVRSEQLELMEDHDVDKGRLMGILDMDRYPLAYDGVTEPIPDPGCSLESFVPGAHVVGVRTSGSSLRRRPRHLEGMSILWITRLGLARWIEEARGSRFLWCRFPGFLLCL